MKKILLILCATIALTTACGGKEEIPNPEPQPEPDESIYNRYSDELVQGTTITTGSEHGYEVKVTNERQFFVEKDSQVRVLVNEETEEKNQHFEMQLLSGSGFFEVKEPLEKDERFNVWIMHEDNRWELPIVRETSEATAFKVELKDDCILVTVHEGALQVIFNEEEYGNINAKQQLTLPLNATGVDSPQQAIEIPADYEATNLNEEKYLTKEVKPIPQEKIDDDEHEPLPRELAYESDYVAQLDAKDKIIAGLQELLKGLVGIEEERDELKTGMEGLIMSIERALGIGADSLYDFGEFVEIQKKELNKLTQAKSSLDQKIEDADEQIATLESQLSQVISERDSIIVELNAVTELYNKALAELKLSQDLVETETKRANGLQTKVFHQGKEIERLNGVIDKWKLDYDELLIGNRDIQDDLDEANLEIERLEAEVAALKAENESYREQNEQAPAPIPEQPPATLPEQPDFPE